MTERNIHDQQKIYRLLETQAETIRAIRASQGLLKTAFAEHDLAILSAIEANRAALQLLLNRLMDEGIKE